MDESSRILYPNESVERVLGYGPEELIGESLTTIMPERFRSEHHAAVGRYLDTGERRVPAPRSDRPDVRHRPDRHAEFGRYPVGFGQFPRNDHDAFGIAFRHVSIRSALRRKRLQTFRSTRPPFRHYVRRRFTPPTARRRRRRLRG
nr:PAS domain S-box protein [Natronomonas sp.]